MDTPDLSTADHPKFKALLTTIEAELSTFAHSIDFQALAAVAFAAFETGGIKSVLPALQMGVPKFCSDPGEAKLIAFTLKLAMMFLHV